MAIGRISGSVLKSNLTRNGVDLAFETNLLYLDVTNSRIGIGTSEPTTELQVAGTVTSTGLTVDTNTLHIDSANNRVGIGTTSPAYQVEIENTSANALLVLDRTDGASTFIEGGATNSVIGSVGANDVKIAYNSVPVVTIGSGGAITTSGNITGGTLRADNFTTQNAFAIVGSDNNLIQDTTLSVDPASNYLGINQTSPEVTLHMTGEGAQTAQIRMEQYNDSADAPDVRTRRYRGTIASPSAVQAGDYLFRSNHEYYNGTSLLVGGAFAFDNTNNANRTQFSVAVDTDGTGADPAGNNGQFKIDGNDSGAITFNNAYKFPTSDGSANQVLQTNGSGTLSFVDMVSSTGDITFTGSTISSPSNADLELNPGGTGVVRITSNILPDTTTTYDIGSDSLRFNDIYLAGTTVDIGGTKLSKNADGDVEIKDSSNVRKKIIVDEIEVGSGNQKIKISRGQDGKVKFSNVDKDADTETTSSILTVVGDDSTGVDLNSGETIKIAGAGGVTTAVSGDTLTITGPTGTLSNIVEDTTPKLGGNLDVNGNSIVSTSNGNIVLDPDGTGVIQVNASIIPETDLTVSLGSPTKKFQDAYFGSGTVYIGDQSITSTSNGLVFSNVTTNSTTDDDTAIVFSKSGIRSSAKTIESFDSSSSNSALYFTVYRDEINDQTQIQKISLAHDSTYAYHSTAGVVVSGSAAGPTFTSNLNGGSVQLKATGSSEANSITGYKISLGTDSSSGTSGHTAIINVGSVVESFASMIDSWSNSSYRAAKYFISARDNANDIINNIEAVVLHDGSSAYLNVYNVVRSGDNDDDLISLSTAINGGNVELSAQSNANDIYVTMHRILLSSDETAEEYANVNIIDEQTISSASTIIDTFNTTKITGALYFVTASNDTSGYYAAGEAYVMSDGTDAYVAVGPNLSSNDAFSVEYSATLSGNTVNFKASASIDSATKITAYRIGLLETQATGDFSQTVTLDTAQNITGNKTFDSAISLSVTNDPTGATNKAHIYAKDESSSAEVFVRDEAGNVTKISPHNEAGEWEYYSRNTKTGKVVRVNMEEMIRDLEQLTGKTYIKNE